MDNCTSYILAGKKMVKRFTVTEQTYGHVCIVLRVCAHLYSKGRMLVKLNDYEIYAYLCKNSLIFTWFCHCQDTMAKHKCIENLLAHLLKLIFLCFASS